MEHLPPTVNVGADAMAPGIAGGTLMGLLPDIAAALSMISPLIQIGDWAYQKFGKEPLRLTPLELSTRWPH